MASNILLVFDFETSGLSAVNDQAVSIAAQAYNLDSLEPIRDSIFNSLMKPPDLDKIDFTSRAFAVNKLTREQLEKAPDQKAVWLQFVEYVNKFNPKRNKYEAPIPGGKNIRGFDLHFVRELNKRYAPKKENTLLFSDFRSIDLEDFTFAWLRDVLPDFKLDTIRKHFGMSLEHAHEALTDVVDTGHMLMRFLKLHRALLSAKTVKGTPLINWSAA